MYVNAISNYTRYQTTPVQKNIEFKSKKAAVDRFIKPANVLRALFLSSILTLGATSCNYNTSSFTPSTRDIDSTELAKHTNLTPEEVNACADAISGVINSPFGSGATNFAYYGVCYDTAKDSSLVLKYGMGGNYIYFAYDKNDKSFYNINDRHFKPATIHHYTDGRFFVVTRNPFENSYLQNQSANQHRTETMKKETVTENAGFTEAEIKVIVNVILNRYNNKKTAFYKGSKTKYVGSEYDEKGKFYLKFETLSGYEYAFYYNKKSKKFVPDNFWDRLGDPNIKFIKNENDGSFVVGSVGMDDFQEYNKDGSKKTE